MKKFLPYVPGLVFFLILIGADLSFNFLYSERSLQFLDMCYRHNEQADFATLCGKISMAADRAFRDATATHFLTYLMVFILFCTSVGQIESLKAKVKGLEDKLNL